jgi:NDP-sugar pyrophosphorylase family protein
VGGEGTRLRPLTYTTPKPLLPIANQPFLERQLSWLARHGVDEVVLSVGYLPDAFEARFPGDRFEGIRLTYAVEREPLGTAGAIRFAADAARERFVVCNGDVLTTLDLAAMVRFHEQTGAEATIHLTRVDDPSPFGVVPTRADGEVIAFVEKPPPGRAPSNWINAGTYVLEPEILERIPPRLPVSIERETFPQMLVASPGHLFAMPSHDYWLDIGTPDKYLRAHLDVLGGALGAPPAPGARELRSGVWVQGSLAVDTRAHLGAPVLVGDGTSVGPGADVRESVLGPGSAVGRGARVLRSVLHAGARVGDDAEVVDSVVGARAIVPKGAVLLDRTVVADGPVVAPEGVV